MAVGVCADWGLVTQAFIRLVDKNEHDIAKTESEIVMSKKVMTILFAQEGIFPSRDTGRSIMPTKMPAIGGYFGAVGVKPLFVTEHIEKTLRRRAVFNCGNEQILLSGPPRTSDVEEIVLRLKFVTAHVIDRAEAEFEHLARFSCFHVPKLREVYSCADPAEARKRQQELQRHIRQIATTVKLDGVAVARVKMLLF